MQEIEILGKIGEDLNQAKEKLASFDFQGEKKTLDVYYFDTKRKNLQPDKDMSLNECFRLRVKGDKNYLTYKIDNFDEKGEWAYSDEHESEFKNLEAVTKIIEHLGLKKLIEIKNNKHIYTTDKFEIVLEDVKDLGLFLEVEILKPGKDVNIQIVKTEIRNFINNLGLSFEELNVGKPELMLRKKNSNL